MARPGENRASLAGLTRVGAGNVPADAGVTVSTAVRVTPANTAEMVAEVEAVTVLVVTVKLAPTGTVTLAGTVAVAELSESDTAAPPVGAAALKVTVPVEEVPPTTLAGFTVTAESVGVVAAAGLTVNTADAVPLCETEMVMKFVAVTAEVVTVKPVRVCPLGR